MSLQRKLFLAFLALWLILLAVCLTSIGVFTSYSHALQRVFHENYDSVVFCDRMKQSLEDLNQVAESSLLENHTIDAAEVSAAEKRFDDNLNAERHNFSVPGERENTEMLAALWNHYENAYEQFHKIGSADRDRLFHTQLLPTFREARRTTQLISDMNLANMKSVDVHARATLLNFRTGLVLSLIVGLSLAAVCVGLLTRAIIRPLVTLTHSAQQVASGNLDLTVPVNSTDQIGELGQAFNSMAKSLREYRRIDHARLQRTQQTTQLAIDSLPDAVAVFRPDGRIEIANRSARCHFQLHPGNNIGQLDLPWLRERFAETLGGSEPEEIRGYKSAIQLFAAGEERFFLPRAVPMLDSHSHVIGVAVILVDVTRLRHADELKSGLVATVSHEIKTPLTSMRMAIHLLADQTVGPLNARQMTLAVAAREDTDRLYRIIENLLDMSRIESGNNTLSLIPVPVSSLLEQATEPFEAALAKKRVTLSMDLQCQISVLADLSCAGHIFTNLLSNALKYAPPESEVKISALEEDEFLNITVADAGPGIPSHDCARIFEKFFRVPTEGGPTGAGLGLSIAQEIAKAHDGYISVESELGRGSTFSVRLKKCL